MYNLFSVTAATHQDACWQGKLLSVTAETSYGAAKDTAAPGADLTRQHPITKFVSSPRLV